MENYDQYIHSLKNLLILKDERRFVAQQLLYLHKQAIIKVDPIIVELGVGTGQSTKVFLNAINEKKNAKLISIDIKDCSNCVNSDKWEFIHQDSTDIINLLREKPEIKQGIDILYVDSLHTAKHVKKEIYSYFKFVKKDGLIIFDDIDSSPYMMGQRKDSVGTEIANRKIYKLLEAIFRANMCKIDFKILRGSTGLAIFKKIVDLGEKLNEPFYIKERNFDYSIFKRLLKKLLKVFKKFTILRA